MAVVLRLARHGRKNLPYYRIVAADKTAPRDGRYIETIGTYNSRTNPPEMTLKEDRVKHWIEAGAKPSALVRSLIRKKIAGYIEAKEQHHRKKIQEARKKRKQRAKAGKAKKK